MTTVLIATNEPVLARGFEAILSAGGLHIAGICTDIGQIFDTFRRSRPDIAILDAAVTPLSAVIIDLRKLAPRCRLLAWPRAMSQAQAQELVRLGAHGVLPSDVTPDVLVNTLNLLASFPESEPAPAALVKHVCSPVEQQIIALVGCGMLNHEIAAVVQSDARAVDEQVKALSRRFGAQDRYELALYGLSISNQATN